MGGLLPGQVLGDTYRVEKLLGRGGMAEVYAVSHLRLPRRFALKLLQQELGSRGRLVRRFEREAEILGRLRHPHIVDVADWNHTEKGEPYLVMELLVGEDLGRFLRHSGALPPPLALHLATQIGLALTAAHELGVVHRDLKPSNIFLSQSGPFPHFVKVLDFGIARLTQLPPDPGPGRLAWPLTARGEVLGTPGYIAPEQVQAGAEVDPRADQFALATILYEMLAGRPAFYEPGERHGVVAALERVLHATPPPLPGAVDAPLALAIGRALSKRPSERFASVAEFLEAAQAASGGRTGAAVPPAPVVLSTQTAMSPRLDALTELTKKRRRLGTLLAVSVLVLVGWVVLSLTFF